MNSVGSSIGALAQKSSLFKNLGQTIADVGSSISGLGMSVTRATAPFAVMSGAVIKLASDFDAAMRNVNAIAQLPEGSFQALKQRIMDFALTTRASAKDVAGALYNVVSAGFDTESAFKLMAAASHAAGAGLASTADTSRLVIAAMRSYNMSVDDATSITDTLLQAVNMGITTLPELAASMGRVLPFASQMGVSLNEVSFSIAQLTQKGLSTEMAVTALMAVIRSLIKPSKELSKAMTSLGFSSASQMVASQGLLGSLKLLKNKGFLDTTEAAAKLFRNSRALTGVFSLVSNDAAMAAGAVEDFGKKAKGAVERAQEQQYASFQTSVLKLRRALEALAISIGSKVLPKFQPIVDGLVEMAHGADSSALSVGKWAVVIGGVGAVAGPALIALGGLVQVFGSFVGLIGSGIGVIESLIGGLASLSTGIGLVAGELGSGGLGAALSGAIALLGGPLTLAIAGVVAATGAFAVAWAKDWGGIRGKVKGAIDAIRPLLEGIQAVLVAVGRAVQDKVVKSFDTLKTKIDSLSSPIQKVSKALAPVGDAFKKGFQKAGESLKGLAARIEDSAVSAKLAQGAYEGYELQMARAEAAAKDFAVGLDPAARKLIASATTDVSQATIEYANQVEDISDKIVALGGKVKDFEYSAEGLAEAQQKLAEIAADVWDKFQSSVDSGIENILSAEQSFQDRRTKLYESMGDQLEKAQESANKRIEKAQEQYYRNLQDLDERYQKKIAEAQAKGKGDRVKELEDEWHERQKKLKENLNRQVADIKEGEQEQLKAIREGTKDRVRELEKGYEAQLKAQKKALANS
jgi:TP901 family phage tail tape measure protein